jgi:glycine/D-amino acid oxidase-like deaminating enzyme
VVLEAQRIAWNASGRNTGFVLPGFGADPETIIERVGVEQARALWTLSEAGFEYVRAASRDMPGVEMTGGGWLNVSKFDDHAATAKRATLLAKEFGAAVEFWPAERVRDALKSPLYFGAVHYPKAFTIHPLNYALGLAAAAEAAGARIFEDTPAVEIDPNGVRKRIDTPSARVRAAHVVLAGSVHIARVMPKIAHTLLPISTYVITTAPLGEKLREVISYPGAVSDTELADNHYRVVGGDRMMWSGQSTVWRGDPRNYVSPLLADMQRAYPQLRDVKVDYAWTGMLGNTVHRMPQIGEVSSGCWLVSGFGGHGLNTSAMGGELIARAIVEDDKTWRQFLPFELVWAGGLLGRAATQVYYWSYRRRERMKSRLACERRRKAEIAA